MAAGALILIGVGLIAGLLIPSLTTDAPTDFRQGTLYLALPRTFPATHRLEWSAEPGELAEIVELGEYPDELPPVVWYRDVERDGEFHLKLFWQVDRDTVQLTFGSTDDLGYSWSPDGRFLAGLRGMRASEDRYITRVVLLDTLGQARQLSDTEYQDGGVIWHPSGTQLAFVRDSAGLKTLWMIDADGGHPRNMSEEFVLPLTTSRAGFSPMGDQLAVVYSDTGSNRGALFVLDLVNRSARALRWTHSPAPAQGGVHWSPDGQWLLYRTATGSRHRLWAISADGAAGPFMVAEPPDSLTLMSWTGGPERYAARVDIEPAILELRKGSGLRAKGMIQTRSGEPFNAPIRWSVGNEAIAGVDDLGFVRGRSAGTTYLIASAGGVIADTVPVNIRFAGIDTLFVEEWADGLDADVWMSFGNPQPIVVGAGLADGRAAFLNNGDFNQLSGAISTVRFDATDSGVTVEVEAWLPFTGDYWQDWYFVFISDSVTLSGSELSLRHSPVRVSFGGSNPIQASAEWSACLQRGDWEPASGNPQLHHIAIQVRPDSVAECYADGVLLARQTIEASLWGKPFAIALMGRTYATNLYHGRVVVTQGLRY